MALTVFFINVIFLQVGAGKKPTTPSYSDTKKVKLFLTKKI